ncbi:MAG TPA: CARDB domain-containing protein [Armatimonadota bacterium]|nr:CARDB domain-containing protein [Armatimonadota bacterium]
MGKLSILLLAAAALISVPAASQVGKAQPVEAKKPSPAPKAPQKPKEKPAPPSYLPPELEEKPATAEGPVLAPVPSRPSSPSAKPAPDAAGSPAKTAPTGTQGSPPAKPAAPQTAAPAKGGNAASTPAVNPAPATTPKKGVAQAEKPAPGVKPVPASKKPTPPVQTAKPEPPPVVPVNPDAYVLRGPLNIPLLQRERRAVVGHSKLGSGALEQIFDGNRNTLVSAAVEQAPSANLACPPPAQAAVPAPPAFWQVTLDRARLVDEIAVILSSSGSHSWSVSAADTEADMKGRRGSFSVLVPPRAVTGNDTDSASFATPRPYRVYRLECRRLSGEGSTELAEWALWSPQELARLEVDAFVPTVAPGTKLQLRADGRFEAGARQNLTPDVKWEVSPSTRAAVDELGRLDGLEPGAARITAIHKNVRSAPFTVEVVPQGQPDWDVTYIERQPRVAQDTPGSGLKEGEFVYWFAHVKNYGTAHAEPVAVEWRLDGKTVQKARLPKVDRFGQSEVMLKTLWDGKRHELELVVDPGKEVAESSEENNSLKVYTDAVSVGFWVEDSLVRYFHRHQQELGIGSNSWEYWAQRQVAMWNRRADEAAAKEGTDAAASQTRWRLDRIIVVGDGMLPMDAGTANRTPDRRDRTVQLMWGFPAAAGQAHLYQRTRDKSLDNPFFYHSALTEALGVLPPKQAEVKPVTSLN